MLPEADGRQWTEATQEIAHRAKDGAPGAFRDLYERIAPSLIAWARLRLGGKGAVESDPEDVLQEVWVRALAEFPRYELGRASFRAWIFGIAKNVLYEIWHQGDRRGMLPRSPEQSAALESWPDVATTIRTRLGREETIEELLRRVEEYDPIDRKLLLHCGFEDMSCPQAARQLGIGMEAAAKRWQRLRARLATPQFASLLDLRQPM